VFDRIRVLVGVDGSLQSRKALLESVTIAKHFSGFMKVVTVYEKGLDKKAEAIVNEVKQTLMQEGITSGYDVTSILGSNPAKALETIAKQENFDLIVIGSRGLGNKVSLLLGSVSKQVVGNARCNVLVVKK
jgi:nucleotide-binding universal stress UspA family protein